MNHYDNDDAANDNNDVDDVMNDDDDFIELFVLIAPTD
jgi:hypothetical protein